MDYRLQVDPDGLRRSSRGYREIQSRVKYLGTALDAHFARYVDSSGNDPTGQDVTAKRQQAQQAILDGIEVLRRTIGYAHTATHGAGEIYENSEEVSDQYSENLRKNMRKG